MRSPVTLWLLLAGVVALGVACGGGGGGSPKATATPAGTATATPVATPIAMADYFPAVDAMFAHRKDASDLLASNNNIDLTQASTEKEMVADVRDYMTKTIALYQGDLDTLLRLGPPAEVQAGHEALIAGHAQVIADLQGELARLGDATTWADVRDWTNTRTAPQPGERLAAACDQLRQVAQANGITFLCQAPP